ncbi:centrosomal protein of 89 kDa isoform X2 [Antennarius striatus]|uniref:centrosomal protein of 89 kDa isoform X2 n=1 Tax=Antennarius striatus TaxID=241820 RepID=UPI0035B0CC2B
MLKFSSRRESAKEFKHITRGLIPAASVAPKPAVPRTPPPRSPHPSPVRPRSALAAAILSASLTGQTWAIPPARPRSFSESGQSESFISEPNISTAFFNRDRWSEDLPSQPCLSSPDPSEDELGGQEKEVHHEEDREDEVYQIVNRHENCSITESVYDLPLNPKISSPQPKQMSSGPVPSTDSTEETVIQSPEISCQPTTKKASVKKSTGSHTEAVPQRYSPSRCGRTKNPKTPKQQPPEPSKTCSDIQGEVAGSLPERSSRLVNAEKLLEERVLRLEQEINLFQASSNERSSAGSQAELQTLKQHDQELMAENNALKLTVHHLNVELSRYQTCFRPLTQHESSKIHGLPKTGSPPPWLIDMKYLSPLLLAYEDKMKEKDALLQTTEEEVKRLRVHVEEVIKENERLHDEFAKFGGISQMDCYQLQQQAFLVLQENRVLIDQLETQHVKAKSRLSRHNSEVSKVLKQVMLLEAENQSLLEDLDKSREEAQKYLREARGLQARLKDVITLDEHCNIIKQLEQQENRNRSERDDLLHKLSSLQKKNMSHSLDKANLTADLKKMEAELELNRQANRKTERKLSALERQKQEYMLIAEKTRHYMAAVVSVSEHISKERDQLIQMVSVLQQEKQDFVNRMENGTVQFENLHEEVKVYRRQASTKLAVLQEETEGRRASYQREILNLQSLLKEKQKAEEILLQSKRNLILSRISSVFKVKSKSVWSEPYARAVAADSGEPSEQETPSVEQQVASYLQSRGIELDREHIEACHPLPVRNERPSALIIRFTNREKKMALLKQGRKLKGTNVFINEHLTKKNADIARIARQLKKQGKIQQTWVTNCKIFIKLNNNRRQQKYWW